MLIHKRISVEDESKRLKLIEQEIARKQDELVEKMHKFEYDYAIVQAHKNVMIDEKQENIDLGIDLEKMNQEEIYEILRKKQEDLIRQTKLLTDKENYLIELQKNILKRETELLNQKAKLDTMLNRAQENEKNKIEELQEIKKNLKEKAKKINEKETEIIHRETEFSNKITEMNLIKEDLSNKSIFLIFLCLLESKLIEKEKLLKDYEKTLQEKEIALNQPEEVFSLFFPIK